MVDFLRRFAVIAVLLFWQGGFTFYAAVVVPIGTDVLGRTQQGVITQRVTNYLNLAGAIALPILAWDMAVSTAGPRWRRRAHWAVWGVLAITLAILAWLHSRLGLMFDVDQLRVVDRESFYAEHRAYLLVSALQWVAGLGALALSLLAWQAKHRELPPDCDAN